MRNVFKYPRLSQVSSTQRIEAENEIQNTGFWPYWPQFRSRYVEEQVMAVEQVMLYGNAFVAATSTVPEFISVNSKDAEYIVLSEAPKSITRLLNVRPEEGFKQEPTLFNQLKARCTSYANMKVDKKCNGGMNIYITYSYVTSLVHNSQLP